MRSITAALLGLMVAASAAQAQSTFYVGAGYQYTSLSLNGAYDKDFAKGQSGIDLHAGWRPTKFFAVELGYQQSSSGDKSIYGPTVNGVKGPLIQSNDLTIGGPTLDVFGYLPLSSWSAVIATVGVTDLEGNMKIDPAAGATLTNEKREFGYRGGAGFELYLNQHTGFRFLGRYQSADFGFAKSAIVGTASINFYF